jgi:hypothetical protein
MQRLPLGYSAVAARSRPLAVLWAILVIAAAFLFNRRALWFVLGAPLALYSSISDPPPTPGQYSLAFFSEIA